MKGLHNSSPDGVHFLMEFFGCDKRQLNSVPFWKKLLINATADSEDDWTHIHFSEVSRKYNPPLIPPLKVRENNPSLSLPLNKGRMYGIKSPSPLRGEGQGEGEYIISGKSGYVMCVTGIGETVQDAREKALLKSGGICSDE